MKRSLAVFSAMAAGILAAFYLGWMPLVWLLAGLALTAVGTLAFIYHRPGLGWVLLAVFCCAAGFHAALLRENYRAQIRWNEAFDRKDVLVEGVLIKRPERMENGTFRLTVRLVSGKQFPGGIVTVYYMGDLPQDCYGRRLQIRGWFRAVDPPDLGLPGFMEQRRIAGSISAVEPPDMIEGPGLAPCFIWAENLRRMMLAFGRQVLRPMDAHVLHGMVLGEDLPEDGAGARMKLAFQRTGTIHLLTVSGLHVSFIVAGLSWLLARLGLPKRGRILPLILGVGFYMLMTGLETPVIRAGLMLLIYMISDLIGVRDQASNRLALAAGILILFNPYTLFEVGFQLSVTATLGVVWLYPKLRMFFPVSNRYLKPLWEVMLLSIGAQLMILPVTVYYFQQISWGSPVVNVILSLPAQVVVMLGLTGEGIGLVFPVVGQWMLTVVGWNIRLIRWLVEIFSGFPWVCSWSPVWPWPWIAGYYLGLVLWLDWRTPNMLTGCHRKLTRGTVFVIVLILLNGIVWGRIYWQWQRDYLEVAVIDVGQGDAIWLRGPGGSTVLVDGGDDGRGRGRVVPFLRRQGISRLDLVFGTHGHQDHLGGLDEVLTVIPAKTVYLPEGADPDGFVIRQLNRQLKSLKIPVCRVSNETRFCLDGRVYGEIMNLQEAMSENDRSLLLWITYGKNKLLLTGDLGEKGEEMVIRKYGRVGRISGLKVGHHGSDTATSWPFLSQLQPDWALISVGRNNRYGHPGAKTLQRLRSMGVKVFRTDVHGTIRLKMYPDKTVIVTEK